MKKEAYFTLGSAATFLATTFTVFNMLRILVLIFALPFGLPIMLGVALYAGYKSTKSSIQKARERNRELKALKQTVKKGQKILEQKEAEYNKLIAEINDLLDKNTLLKSELDEFNQIDHDLDNAIEEQEHNIWRIQTHPNADNASMSHSYMSKLYDKVRPYLDSVTGKGKNLDQADSISARKLINTLCAFGVTQKQDISLLSEHRDEEHAQHKVEPFKATQFPAFKTPKIRFKDVIGKGLKYFMIGTVVTLVGVFLSPLAITAPIIGLVAVGAAVIGGIAAYSQVKYDKHKDAKKAYFEDRKVDLKHDINLLDTETKHAKEKITMLKQQNEDLKARREPLWHRVHDKISTYNNHIRQRLGFEKKPEGTKSTTYVPMEKQAKWQKLREERPNNCLGDIIENIPDPELKYEFEFKMQNRKKPKLKME